MYTLTSALVAALAASTSAFPSAKHLNARQSVAPSLFNVTDFTASHTVPQPPSSPGSSTSLYVEDAAHGLPKTECAFSQPDADSSLTTFDWTNCDAEGTVQFQFQKGADGAGYILGLKRNGLVGNMTFAEDDVSVQYYPDDPQPYEYINGPHAFVVEY